MTEDWELSPQEKSKLRAISMSLRQVLYYSLSMTDASPMVENLHRHGYNNATQEKVELLIGELMKALDAHIPYKPKPIVFRPTPVDKYLNFKR